MNFMDLCEDYVGYVIVMVLLKYQFMQMLVFYLQARTEKLAEHQSSSSVTSKINFDTTRKIGPEVPLFQEGKKQVIIWELCQI